MTDLFGHDDLVATARRAPAPGPPSDFGESLRSAFNVTMEVGRSISDDKALRDTYQKYLDEVQELTGKAIPNPQHPGVLDQPKAEAMVLEQVRKLREKFPDIPLRTPEDIRAGIGRDRAAARETRAEVARREIGFGANAGAFLGTAGAIMTDPPVFASMFFGAPWATSLLRAAVIEAGAAGAGETLAQIGIQTGRRQFGEEADIGEAATAVAIAAAGAGVLAPVVRGGAAGVRALLKQAQGSRTRGSLAKAAERFLRRQVELEEASPFDAAPAARAEHAARLTEAQVALREGRPARMTEQPRAAVREDAARATTSQDFGDDELGRLASEVAEARGRPTIQAPEAVVSPAPEPVAPPPQPSRPPLARRTLAEEPDTLLAEAEEEALEARVRAMAEAEPGARVTIEDGDTLRSMTMRELIEELDSDRKFGEEVTACLGGVL